MTTEATDAGAAQEAKSPAKPLTGAELAVHRESRANRAYWQTHHLEIMAEHPGKDYLIIRGGELLVFDELKQLFEAYDQLDQPIREAAMHPVLRRRPPASNHSLGIR